MKEIKKIDKFHFNLKDIIVTEHGDSVDIDSIHKKQNILADKLNEIIEVLNQSK